VFARSKAVEFKSNVAGGRSIPNGRVPLRQLTLVNSGNRPEQTPRESSSPAASPFSPAEMRHSFAIWALKRPGAFRRRPYVYHCLRCKWTFRVDGSIIALDTNGNPLRGAEAARRAVTFALGPCPVFNYLTPYPRTTHSLPRLNILQGRLAALAAAMRSALKRSVLQGDRAPRAQS
jgi:hypothetical protein